MVLMPEGSSHDLMFKVLNVKVIQRTETGVFQCHCIVTHIIFYILHARTNARTHAHILYYIVVINNNVAFYMAPEKFILFSSAFIQAPSTIVRETLLFL